MEKYTMLWLDENEKWIMFKGDISNIDTSQFKDGYVDYRIEVENDVIITDTWKKSNENKVFSNVYNMLKIVGKEYIATSNYPLNTESSEQCSLDAHKGERLLINSYDVENDAYEIVNISLGFNAWFIVPSGNLKELL